MFHICMSQFSSNVQHLMGMTLTQSRSPPSRLSVAAGAEEDGRQSSPC